MAATKANEIQAEKALAQAMNGELFEARQKYSLGWSGKRYRTTLPKAGVQNLDVDVGDNGAVFISKEHNAVVICYSED